ncbi:hypothetical protein ACVWWG_009384 [Bradyrhizobium sp. LB7.2]
MTEIDRNPTYRYNPAYDFKGVHSHKPFIIMPGPNNPVGSMWINLSRDGDRSVQLLLSQLERRRRQRVAMDAGIDERIQNIISGQAPSLRPSPARDSETAALRGRRLLSQPFGAGWKD